MDSNTWLIILVVILVAFCIGPMLFMRKRRGDSHEVHKTGRDSKSDSKPSPKSGT